MITSYEFIMLIYNLGISMTVESLESYFYRI